MKRLLLAASVLLLLGALAPQASGKAVQVSGTDGHDVLVVTATGPDSGTYSLNGAPGIAFHGATLFSFAASAAGLAPRDPLESAIAATLPPGPYTALLRGVNNGTGNGLVEVYDRGGP